MLNEMTDIKEDGGDYDEELDNSYKVYKTGVVRQGVVRMIGDSEASLVGCSSYFITEFNSRIIYNGNEDIIYVLEQDPHFMQIYRHGEFNSNFVFVRDYSSGIFSDPIFEREAVFKSDNKHEYKNLSLFSNFPGDSLKIVDTVIGHNIYSLTENEGGLFYVKNKDGIYSTLRYRPPFGSELYNSSNQLRLKISENDYFSANYSYLNLCSHKINLVDLETSSLEKVGTLSNGDPIYQYKDRETVRDLYDYYIETYGIWDNLITQDNENTYTFEQFEKSYPVLFWLSPFGKFITLVREDFNYKIGCG